MVLIVVAIACLCRLSAHVDQPAVACHSKDEALTVQSPLDKTHARFSAELSKYVNHGRVDYRAWKKDRKGLDEYLDALSKIDKDQYQRLSGREKLALWINAYNAFTIALVLDHYPINGLKSYYPKDSIRQIDGFWENNFINVCGRKVTLESMEHDILRRDFLEPRTHFAVVCAARGSARLSNKAYTAAALDEELELATSVFVSDSKNVSFDEKNKVLHVSSLFKWFPLDFATAAGMEKRVPPPTDDEIVAAYLLKKAPQAVRQKLVVEDGKGLSVIYKSYDWSLNDAEE